MVVSFFDIGSSAWPFGYCWTNVVAVKNGIAWVENILQVIFVMGCGVVPKGGNF